MPIWVERRASPSAPCSAKVDLASDFTRLPFKVCRGVHVSALLPDHGELANHGAAVLLKT
jgi:hypothetical protein